METRKDCVPACALKCLRNVEDVSNIVHSLKYGVNTIGRGLNNDIVLRNLNVSRTHCHLRVEKKESKDIAYIKDLGTSNGTIVGNINLIEFEEHKLNDLDMIVLASGDEGVVLQYIDQTDHTIILSSICNNQINNKRKVLCTENSDELTNTKIPKLVLNEPIIKDPFLIENTSLPNESKQILNSVYNLKCSDLNQSTSKSVNDSHCQVLQTEELNIVPSNYAEPSCSHYTDNIISSVKIKTEPETVNHIFSQGTYRNEGDSVIVIYSSDEENDINENDLKLSKSEIEIQKQTKLSTSIINSYPSTSKEENNLYLSEWPIERNEIVSDDEDDLMPLMLNSNANNEIMNSSESGYISKCPKIIEPIPLKTNKKKELTKALFENTNIKKTRAKAEKKIINKKKVEEMTVDQNKQIMLERRLKLQQLTKNKCSSLSEVKMDTNLLTDDADKPSTTDQLKKRTRISRLQQNNIDNCLPSTSKSYSTMEIKKNDTLCIGKNVKKNNPEILSKIKNVQHSLSSCNNMDSSANKIINLVNFAYFDTLSRICKWNAVWLLEEKFVDRPPPLVKTMNKMKIQFENPSEYSSIVTSLLLHEIWSKLSESYNIILHKNPTLEKCIFEKSIKKDISLLSFEIQSVNKDFSTSVRELKSISEPLWCLKCTETKNKSINTLGPRFSLKGYLCIVIIQSKSFGTDTVSVKKPTKSKNIFFAYVNVAKKIGLHSNTQLYLELIVTRKTEIIPNGTLIHLMDICYLHSELRLFQAINYMTTSSLRNAFITTSQLHNYTIDCSKVILKNYNANSFMLNNSQKEAVKMAMTICSTKTPNVGLIIGPPGTGKTNVICNIIINMISKLQVKPKLLICAPSNEAVDAIVKRILEIKKDIKHELQFSIVRVGGQKYDPNSPIVDVMLDTLVNRRMNNTSNEDDQHGSLNIFYNKKDLEIDILRNTDVIMTTLNSCFSKKMEDAFMSLTLKSMNNCHFTACIVDEAGQCIEPLNFVPMLLGIDKFILVGDDKQLQPVVKSKSAKENGLGISLFKRLKTWLEHKRYTQKNFPITTLDVQYRMHHEICLFPSKYFYKGKIKTAPSVKTRDQLSLQPYIILEHESQQDNSGEVNIGEANMIVNLVDILLKSEYKSLNIAVLTPYTKQKEQINTLLENKKISLNVNTIDSFQGSECDVLLISTVRTNGVGFMDDMCRLNVALTRAKQSLIICGNFMSLKGEQVWCDLLEDARKRKLIKKVSKRVINNSKALHAMIKY